MASLGDKIVEYAIALLIFSVLGGTVFTGIENLIGNVTDATTKLVLALVATFFALGVALSVYYGLMKHKKSV